jgi:hypothetical protein
MDKDRALAHLHEALGYRPLGRTWAKVEILLGLLAVGVGAFLGNAALGRGGEWHWPLAVAGLLLFVLGGYLALAGHRSHLYQSNNELAAYLAEEVRSWRQGSR